MVTRVNLGENSARFDIGTYDTVAEIESVLRTFLNSRGWTLIGSAVNFGASTFTYSSPTMKGGTKRMRLAFFTSGSGFGSTIHLGISILNEVGSNETGYLANLFTTDPLYEYQTFLIKSRVVVQFYCFANPRWCYFTSKIGSYLYDINFCTPTEAANVHSWDGKQYIKSRLNILLTKSPIAVNGKVVSKSIPEEFYNNTSGVLDSIYGHSDIDPISPLIVTTYQTTLSSVPTFNASKSSLRGCTEILDTDSPRPFAILDTASLLTSFADEKDIERAIKKELTNTYYKDSQKMLGNSFEMTNGNLTACYLLGDSTHYGDISLGVDNFKISGKNLISAIHTSSKNYGYTGKFYGLVLTQANKPTKFLEEKWLRVDENFNPSPNGELRKFFVVPGYSRVSSSSRRQWNFSSNTTKFASWVNHLNILNTGTEKDWRYLNDSQKSRLLFRGDWETGSFEAEDYYSFLIPA